VRGDWNTVAHLLVERAQTERTLMHIKETDWNTYVTKALDIHFNVAVLHIAQRLFPCGFDVLDDAPGTYERLICHLDSGKRMAVRSGGSEQTIFGDPEVNYAFRAWHDWCHWRGRHTFTFYGELAAYDMQCAHLVELYGVSDQTKNWQRIVYAEIIGQRLFCDRYGQFPDNQRAFVESFLAYPKLLAAE
jgi:hypothetical protein